MPSTSCSTTNTASVTWAFLALSAALATLILASNVPNAGSTPLSLHDALPISGSGWTPASDGATVDFSISSGPGTFVGGGSTATCTTSGGSGSCSVDLTS